MSIVITPNSPDLVKRSRRRVSLAVSFLLLVASGCASARLEGQQPVPVAWSFDAAVANCEEALAGYRSIVEGDARGMAYDHDHAPWTRLEIRSVGWTTVISAEPNGTLRASQSHELLNCVLDQWPGYDEMELFSAAADPVFFLESPGHRRVEARMAKGGMGDVEAAWGVTMIVVPPDLEPGVRYRLRPRDASAGYGWSVADHVVVIAR